jgi:ferredoxin-NADP reductase
LSSAPERADGLFTITVKAVPGGAVSTDLVHRTRPGTIIDLTWPEGDFVLPRPVPSRLLLVTAGSGITPVMAMLRSLVWHGAMPDVVLLHSAPTREEVIFGEELRMLARQTPGLRLHEQHTRSDGRLSLSRLPDLCPDWTRRGAWLCGPTGMLDEAETLWREAGIAGLLHTERFRPVVAVTACAAAGVFASFRAGRKRTPTARPRCWSWASGQASSCRAAAAWASVTAARDGCGQAASATCEPGANTGSRETSSRPACRPPPALWRSKL